MVFSIFYSNSETVVMNAGYMTDYNTSLYQKEFVKGTRWVHSSLYCPLSYLPWKYDKSQIVKA